MSTDLRLRLQDLARDTDTTPGRPDELWQRGKSWQRRRNAGVAVIAAAAVAALGTLGTTSWQRAAAPAPASGGSTAVLPDRIYTPSGWLPGTAEAGAPGRLVAVLGATRGRWTGSETGVVGISATTGEYRFLDLPDDAVQSTQVALSPDGSRLAFWLSGEPSGSPNTMLEGDVTIVGVGVYDSTTGEVEREVLSTEHGLAARQLGWADEDTLFFEYGQIVGGDDASPQDQGTSMRAPLRVWSAGEGESRVLGLERPQNPGDAGMGADGRLLFEAGRGVWVVDVDEPDAARLIRVEPRGGLVDFVLDPSGTSIAGIRGARSGIWTGELPSSSGPTGVSTITSVSGSRGTLDLHGWIDGTHVAVLGYQSDDLNDVAVFSVDVITGKFETLVRVPPATYGVPLQFASDLLASPVVDATAPPNPLDPRLIVGLGCGICGVALALVLVWRRRVRP